MNPIQQAGVFDDRGLMWTKNRVPGVKVYGERLRVRKDIEYPVEFSPRSTRDLLWNMEPRPNVIPILDDAGKPERYAPYIDRHVGTLIQDVAQRHQVDIFLRNLTFVKGHAFLFVKARSIDVAASLEQVYNEVRRRLKEAGCNIISEVDLEPFEKEHRAFVVKA